MKYPKAYLNHVDKLVSLFQGKMLLMEYDISTKNASGLMSRRYNSGYTAEIETDTRYLDARVTLGGKFYKKWQQKDYKGMAELMCHELAHIYTDPYYEFYWDTVPKKLQKQLQHLNEQQTERIARVIMLNVRPKDYLP